MKAMKLILVLNRDSRLHLNGRALEFGQEFSGGALTEEPEQDRIDLPPGQSFKFVEMRVSPMDDDSDFREYTLVTI